MSSPSSLSPSTSAQSLSFSPHIPNPLKFLNVATQLATHLKSIHLDEKRQMHGHIYKVEVASDGSVSLGFDEMRSVPPLDFMSPEQTGRMNRNADHRTDFYSLGILYYAIFTGHLPFQSPDPLELIYSHIVKRVPDLKGAPVMINAIVQKCLAKMPDERYQSCVGLLEDLNRCKELIETHHSNDTFELGTKDFSGKLSLSDRLYGREEEIHAIVNVLKPSDDYVGTNTATTTDTESVMNSSHFVSIAGHSGVGKSAIVREVQKIINPTRGFLVMGKFDIYQKTVPYSALKSALNDLIRELLMESDAKLQKWKQRIKSRLGANAGVLTSFLPTLEVLIGECDPVIPLEGKAAQDRFVNLMVQLLRAVATEERPLIIFLDDFQWADIATIELVKVILLRTAMKGVLFSGAYRDNEVDEHHPYYIMLEELRNSNGACNLLEFNVQPLKLPHIQDMICDATHRPLDDAETRELAQVLLEKTLGNPFFIHQMCKKMVESKLLVFDYATCAWNWNLAGIRDMEISNNVVAILVEKIHTLSKETQLILKLASIAGHTFSTRSIIESMVEIDTRDSNTPGSTFSSFTASQLQSFISEAVLAELITPVRTGSQVMQDEQQDHYRFVHDRVQQASYTLLSDEERMRQHLNFGQYLLKKSREVDAAASVSTSTGQRRSPTSVQPTMVREKIFSIVDHLNMALFIITDESSLCELSYLNYMASSRAYESVAYAASQEYIQQALTIYPKNLWQDDKDFAIKLYLLELKLTYVMKTPTEASQKAQELLTHLSDPLQRASVYKIQVSSLLRVGRMKETAEMGSVACKELGYNVPANPGKGMMLSMLLKAFLKLRKKNPNDLYEKLPIATDESAKVVSEILMSMSTAAFTSGNDPLTVVTTLTSVLIALEKGACEFTNWTTMALILCGMGKYQLAYDYARLSLRYGERLNNAAQIGIASFILFGFLNHLFHPFSESLELYQRADQNLLQSGELLYWSYCESTWNAICIELKDIEERLTSIEKSIAYFHENAKEDEQIDACYAVWEAYYRCLADPTREGAPISLMDAGDFDKEKFLELVLTLHSASLHFFYHSLLTAIHMFNGDYDAAQREGDITLKKFTNAGTSARAMFTLYYSLSVTQSSRPRLKKLKKVFPEITKMAMVQFRNWGGTFLLVLGEISRVKYGTARATRIPKKIRKVYTNWIMNVWRPTDTTGKAREALLARISKKLSCEDLYDMAIDVASIDSLPIFLSIFNEVAGRHYMRQNTSPRVGIIYLHEAHRQWMKYGAIAKAEHLKHEFPQLSNPIVGTDGSNAPGSAVGSVDVVTITKASQALSKEIKLHKVLRTLLKLAIQNAGAEAGVLLLLDKSRNDLVVVAEGKNDEQGDVSVSMVDRVLVQDHPDLSLKLVNLCKRQQEDIIVADAKTDPKLQGQKLHEAEKSLMLLPILRKGEVLGMVYLRNRTFTHAFTEQHKRTLEIMASQAGISLENAEMYENLEGLIAKRTEELNNLLENVYPVSILNRMRQGETKIVDSIDGGSVFFSDICRFTNFTNRNHVNAVYDMLDWVFGRMDVLVKELSLEKIKTIGDAMVVASFSDNHACVMAEFALRTLDVVRDYNEYVREENKRIEEYNATCDPNHITAEQRGYTQEELAVMEPLSEEDAEYYVHKYNRIHEMYNKDVDAFNKERVMNLKKRRLDMIEFRIGCNSGPLIAGIFTETRPIYDILGNVCNVACRMESHGEPGRVHVSEEFAELVKHEYALECRGEMEVKGKGMMKTYFLSRKDGDKDGPGPNVGVKEQ